MLHIMMNIEHPGVSIALNMIGLDTALGVGSIDVAFTKGHGCCSLQRLKAHENNHSRNVLGQCVDLLPLGYFWNCTSYASWPMVWSPSARAIPIQCSDIWQGLLAKGLVPALATLHNVGTCLSWTLPSWTTCWIHNSFPDYASPTWSLTHGNLPCRRRVNQQVVFNLTASEEFNATA